MSKYVVAGDSVNLLPVEQPLYEDLWLEEQELYRDSYGLDWIMVEAESDEDALEQAREYDSAIHPSYTEMQTYATEYQIGGRSLWE